MDWTSGNAYESPLQLDIFVVLSATNILIFFIQILFITSNCCIQILDKEH